MMETVKGDSKPIVDTVKEAERRFEELKEHHIKIMKYLKTLCEFGRVMKDISDRLTQIDYIYDFLQKAEVQKVEAGEKRDESSK